MKAQQLFGEYNTQLGRITLHDPKTVEAFRKSRPSSVQGNWNYEDGVFPIYAEQDETGQLIRLVIDLNTEE